MAFSNNIGEQIAVKQENNIETPKRNSNITDTGALISPAQVLHSCPYADPDEAEACPYDDDTSPAPA